jgi:cytochrome c peroxidase
VVKTVFSTKAKCAVCHAAPLFADNVLHTAGEIGIDDLKLNVPQPVNTGLHL